MEYALGEGILGTESIMIDAATELQQTEPLTLRERLEAFVELTKPRIAITLVLTAAAAFYIGSAGRFDLPLFFHSMLGILLLAFGVASLNQWMERETDALMLRTQDRPIPSGRLSATQAFLFGLALCILAEFYLLVFVNQLTALLGLVVIVGYVLIYTPLKVRTPYSTAIGAVPGAMPPLLGWAAASGEVSLGGWILFGVMVFWQYPHFLAIALLYKDDYARAGIKMLPVVENSGNATARQMILFASALLPLSLAPYLIGLGGYVFLIGALILGIWYLVETVRATRSRTDRLYRKLILVSIVYLPVYFLLLVLGA